MASMPSHPVALLPLQTFISLHFVVIKLSFDEIIWKLLVVLEAPGFFLNLQLNLKCLIQYSDYFSAGSGGVSNEAPLPLF